MAETIKIPLDIKGEWGLNKIYAGVHWIKRKKDKEYIKLLVRSVTGVRKKVYSKPVKLSMSFNSRLDISNHAYLFKMIEDSLVACIFFSDDNDKFVKKIEMEKQTEFKGVVVKIEEI